MVLLWCVHKLIKKSFIIIKMKTVLSHTDACCLCMNKIYMHLLFIFTKLRFKNSNVLMFTCFRCFKLYGQLFDEIVIFDILLSLSI